MQVLFLEVNNSRSQSHSGSSAELSDSFSLIALPQVLPCSESRYSLCSKATLSRVSCSSMKWYLAKQNLVHSLYATVHMSNGVSAKLLSLFLFHLFLSCISSISVFREKGLERENYKMWYCWTISLNAVKKSCKGWSEWYYRSHRNKCSGQTVAYILQLWNVDVTSNEERFSSRKTYSAQLKTGSTDYKSGFSIFRIIINNLRLSFASMTVGDSKKYPLVYEFSGGEGLVVFLDF